MPLTLAGSSEALDASLNTIITEFNLLSDEEAVCKSNATKYTLKPHSGRAKVILNYGRLVAYALQDGVDMAQAQALADTQTTYTPNEVGLQVVLPATTLRRVADVDLLKRTGEMMRRAYNLREDQDGVAQFSSWTPTMGGTTTVPGLGHIAASRARIRIGNNTANPEPFSQGEIVGIMHPYPLHALAMRAIPLTDVPAGTTAYSGVAAGQTVGPGRGGSDLSDEILRRGVPAFMNIAGVKMYEDANITVTSTPSAVNAIFSRQGYIYTSEFEPTMAPEEKDASLRGLELNLVGSYVFGLYRSGASGVALTTDCTAPTA